MIYFEFFSILNFLLLFFVYLCQVAVVCLYIVSIQPKQAAKDSFYGILLLLVLLGIPTRVGQNRSQPVFASWYDDSWLINQSSTKGKGLKAPLLHFALLGVA